MRKSTAKPRRQKAPKRVLALPAASCCLHPIALGRLPLPPHAARERSAGHTHGDRARAPRGVLGAGARHHVRGVFRH